MTVIPEVHEQMFRSGGHSDAKPPSAEFPSKLGTHLSTHLRDERLSLPCPWEVVKVMDSCPACHEFEPSAAEDPPWGCGSPVVKVSNHGRHVMSSIQVPLKTRRVGHRCTLNLSRAETSSRWCGVVVRRGGCQLRCRPRHLTMVQNYVVRRQKPSCS
ncbi:uncharacterized protein TNCV_5120621 [Trichonephila clavipes]|nr:uncharacterized protein TNCV_5120621 [Trichonephila clavipes]